MSYQHLALEEWHYIETQWKLGVSQNRIAQALGRSQSSVSRELSRNRGFSGATATSKPTARLGSATPSNPRPSR